MDKATEVGQKMRSAIKAKLIELGCYVDDELPDYIMVMVANRRSKAMMTEDLLLFLNENTEPFVNWLHQVLRKLQEVTVTNIDVPKITKQEARLKRKIIEKPANLISEAIEKNKSKKVKVEKDKTIKTPDLPLPAISSITDEIPVSASKIAERKSASLKSLAEQQRTAALTTVAEDSFDIPSVSDVDRLEESQLADIESKILNAKKKLASMQSDSEDEDFINLKPEEELLTEAMDDANSSKNKLQSKPTRIVYRTNNDTNLNTESNKDISPKSDQESHTPPRELAPKRIISTIKVNEDNTTSDKEVPPKKKSVLERLGKRPVEKNQVEVIPKKKICLSEIRREEEEILGIKSKISVIERTEKSSNKDQSRDRERRQNIYSRIGIMSHVIPVIKNKEKPISPPRKPTLNTTLPSVVQVKPRKMVPKHRQANKNLLLKAVAEAQKSVNSALVKEKETKQSNVKSDKKTSKKELFTKHFKKSMKQDEDCRNKLNSKKLERIRIQVPVQLTRNKTPEPKESDESDSEYIPKPVIGDNVDNELTYVPSEIDNSCDSDVLKDDDNTIAATNPEKKQRFIVTLNGVDDSLFKNSTINSSVKKNQPEDQEKIRKKHTPSPIIFDKNELDQTAPVVAASSVTEKPPNKVYPVIPLKVKERCKYWPGCRQGESCEYVHPSTPCKTFPLCVFGDKCLYIHPKCKFDVSCTRRECPYSHGIGSTKSLTATVPTIASRIVPVINTKVSHVTTNPQQVCKYFPQCSNPQCHFYHPRVCRFGKNCANKECNFFHDIPTKDKLTWRSPFQA